MQHGISYLTACAPIAISQGIERIYIPATHTSEYDSPWGSHPDLDNCIKFVKTECQHDGFELSRQQKWQKIIKHFDDREGVHIQSCATPGNCNDCFHCARNIAALLVENEDPSQYGYDYSDRSLRNIQEKITSGSWEMDKDHKFFWKNIQDHVPNEVKTEDSQVQAFLKWLSDVDLNKL